MRSTSRHDIELEQRSRRLLWSFGAKGEPVAVLEEENASNSQEARDKLPSLILALQKATGDSIKVTSDAAQVLSSEEATSLVIASLTDKISELSVQNSQLVERMETMQDIMEDFESENEACLHKMDALEMQLKSINKTRQRVVSRLTYQRHVAFALAFEIGNFHNVFNLFTGNSGKSMIFRGRG